MGIMKNLIQAQVEVTRGQQKESLHEVTTAVFSKNSFEHAEYSESVFTFPRSAIKPLQTLILLDSQIPLSPEKVAIASASHGGEPKQILILKQWLEELKISPEQLKCGFHLPTSEQPFINWVKSGERRLSIYNNCAGKHLGILQLCMVNDWPMDSYENVEHPYQQLVRSQLSEWGKFPLEEWGVDGCGIPTYIAPIDVWARVGAHLFEASESQKIIKKAMIDFPELMCGEDSWQTRWSKIQPGRISLKSGAEGVLIGWLWEEEICFFIKSMDGSQRPLELAAAHIVNDLIGLNFLDSVNTKVYNWNNFEVGNLRYIPL